MIPKNYKTIKIDILKHVPKRHHDKVKEIWGRMIYGDYYDKLVEYHKQNEPITSRYDILDL